MTMSPPDLGQTLEPIPAFTGVGFKGFHFDDALNGPGKAGWLEVHAENYMAPPHLGLDRLLHLRADYHVSIHGVGLSLGSAGPLDPDHLKRLKALVGRVEPFLISEHLSWSVHQGSYLNDLLPLPYTKEALDSFAGNVSRVQEALKQRILIENPSVYVRIPGAEMDEPEFFNELVWKTGCAMLLDVNNVYVSAHNTGFDPADYLRRVPVAAIEEIHLAGHARREAGGRTILIDDHGSPVPEPVWALYQAVLARIGPRPTLVEWDTDVPPFATLIEEARKADAILMPFFYQGLESGERQRALA